MEHLLHAVFTLHMANEQHERTLRERRSRPDRRSADVAQEPRSMPDAA